MVEIHFIRHKIAKTPNRTADTLQMNFHGSLELFVLLKVKKYTAYWGIILSSNSDTSWQTSNKAANKNTLNADSQPCLSVLLQVCKMLHERRGEAEPTVDTKLTCAALPWIINRHRVSFISVMLWGADYCRNSVYFKLVFLWNICHVLGALWDSRPFSQPLLTLPIVLICLHFPALFFVSFPYFFFFSCPLSLLFFNPPVLLGPLL